LEAHLTYANGDTATWRPPSGDRFLGTYWAFRWRKWANNVVDRSDRPLHREAARYIARENRRGEEYPVRVTLVKLTYEAPAPGSGRSRDTDPDWNEAPYYTLLLSPDGRSRTGR